MFNRILSSGRNFVAPACLSAGKRFFRISYNILERFGGICFGGDSEGNVDTNLQAFLCCKGSVFNLLLELFGKFCGGSVGDVRERNDKPLIVIPGQQGSLLKAVAGAHTQYP